MNCFPQFCHETESFKCRASETEYKNSNFRHLIETFRSYQNLNRHKAMSDSVQCTFEESMRGGDRFIRNTIQRSATHFNYFYFYFCVVNETQPTSNIGGILLISFHTKLFTNSMSKSNWHIANRAFDHVSPLDERIVSCVLCLCKMQNVRIADLISNEG